MNVTREILGFARDESGEWIAHLGCHHRRHIRHNPPLSSYAWIEDPEARAAHVGQAIECGRCEQRVWPEGLTRYRATKSFDEATTPAGLRADHTTRDGVWARVEVEAGGLTLCFASPLDTRVRVEAGGWAAIPPTLKHHLEFDGAVRFCVSFWRP